MSQNIDREGTFRGVVEQSVVRKLEGKKSVPVSLRVAVASEYTEGEAAQQSLRDAGYTVDKDGFCEWPSGTVAEYDAWVIKKDGTPNKFAVDGLVEAFGWDGSLKSVSAFIGQSLQFTVEREEWEGNVRYKIGFINPVGAVRGGGLRSAPEGEVAALSASYDSQLKAFAAQARKELADSAPAPSAPPAAAPAPEATPF